MQFCFPAGPSEESTELMGNSKGQSSHVQLRSSQGVVLGSVFKPPHLGGEALGSDLEKGVGGHFPSSGHMPGVASCCKQPE